MQLLNYFKRKAPLLGSFGGGVAMTMGGNIAIAAVGLLTGSLAARLLGPTGRGQLAAIQMWPSALLALAVLGTGDAVVYFSAREPKSAGRHVASSALLGLLASTPFMALAYLLLPVLLSAQTPAVIQSARWYLLIIPLIGVMGMPVQALRGRSEFGMWNGMRILPNLGWLTVLLASYVLERRSPGWISAGQLYVIALLIFPVWWLVGRQLDDPYRPDPRLWRPMVKYGLPVALGNVPLVLNLRLDQMLLAAFIAPNELGLYVVAVAWAGIGAPIVSAVGAVAFPHIAAAADRDRSGSLCRITRLGAALSALLNAPLLLITPVALPLLFGRSFAPAVPSALILVGAGAFLSVNGVLEQGSMGLGDTKAVVWGELSGLAGTAIGLGLLLRPMGIVGASIASLAGYSVTTIFLTYRICSRTGCSPGALYLPHATDLAVLRSRIASLLNAPRLETASERVMAPRTREGHAGGDRPRIPVTALPEPVNGQRVGPKEIVVEEVP